MFAKNFPGVKTLLLDVAWRAGWDTYEETLAWGLFNHIHFPANSVSHLDSWLHNCLRDQLTLRLWLLRCISAAVVAPSSPANPWPQPAADIYFSDIHGNTFGPVPTQKKPYPGRRVTDTLRWGKDNMQIQKPHQTIKRCHHQRPNNWRWSITGRWRGPDRCSEAVGKFTQDRVNSWWICKAFIGIEIVNKLSSLVSRKYINLPLKFLS